MYDNVFCPVLVFQKGCLSLEKLFLMSILQRRANSKISRLVACRRFAIVRISDNGPGWKLKN